MGAKRTTPYPNLVAELTRLGIDRKELCDVIHATEMTIYRKLNGDVGEFSISECKMIKALEPDFKIFHFEKKRGFTWQLNDEEKQEIKSETSNALKFASKVMDTGQCDVLILDEILNSLELGFVSEEEVITLIENKSDDVELVLTGRTLPESIANKADYISRIESIKHPMDKGIDARKGIEY